MVVAYTVTHNDVHTEDDSVFIQLKGKAPVIISRKDGEIRYANILRALEEKNDEDVEKLIDLRSVLHSLNDEDFVVEGDRVYFKSKKLPRTLSDKLISMYVYGEPDIGKYYKFVRRIWENPSKRSRKQLFTFLQERNLPLLEDGRFLAYKGVSERYRDQHSGMFDNTVGAVNKMDRDDVDPDKKQHCSTGFHVGSYEYAKGFMGYGGHLMFVAVDPYYVVSVPEDSDCQKCRVSEYEVIGEDSTLVELEKPSYSADKEGKYNFLDTDKNIGGDVKDTITRMCIKSAIDRHHYQDIFPTIRQIDQTIRLGMDYDTLYDIITEMDYTVEDSSYDNVEDLQIYPNPSE